MIYYQIEDVDVMFKDLEKLEAQNWVVVKEPAKNPPTKAKKLVKKVTTKPKAAKKSPSKATTSLKEMMAAKRREMKEKENATAAATSGLSRKELQVWSRD